MPVHKDFLTKFDIEFGRLNQEQKKAVETIEGPVMVIAGAGTGKTQTIALRIANILLKTQTSPGSILCLTFTENAALNMRQRLLKIIGPAAYSIRIHTFHSFCNDVILNNPEHFLFASDIKPLDELEKLEIIENLIENLPDGSVLKPWGDHLYYQKDIISRIQTLKRENVTVDRMSALIDDQKYFIDKSGPIFESIKALRASKSLESELLALVAALEKIGNLSLPIAALIKLNLDLYHRGQFSVGKAKNPAVNFKNELLKFYDNLIKAIPRQEALKSIYSNYEAELKARSRYDFDDMILFVLNAFRNNIDLLSAYQERFQYILVDEYQDTNTAQNEIINLLGSYFEIPNIFVVGDDDQSIFRFQGAAIENIFDFYQRYKSSLSIVVLKNNYRSHQLILDSSGSVISHNQNRIANYIQDIDKSLKSAQGYDPTPINVYAAPSTVLENYYIAQQIKKLVDSGIPPSEIAVLYRHNNDVNDLKEMLDNMGIPYRLESGSDVLGNPHIRQLISLLSYIENPTDDNLLFKILAYPFLKISQLDLFKLVRFADRQGILLSDLIGIPENLEKVIDFIKPVTAKRLRNFLVRLSKARRWKEIYSLEKFFNRVIRRFGFLKFLMSLNDVDEISCLNDFYRELKRLSLDEDYDLSKFNNRINLLLKNNLSLPVSSIDGEDNTSVRLMTVHKAKGLEFEHVFLIKVLDKKWGNNLITSSLTLPMGILRTELSSLTVQDENEEERRLFYVALTRAKKQLYLTYPRLTPSGRELLPSMFISEIDPSLLEPVNFKPATSTEALFTLFPENEQLPYKPGRMSEFLKRFIESEYKFNVSHLNSYLKCPLCFYYRTILRIPSVKDKFASMGTAVHSSLSYLLNNLKSTGKLISKEEFLNHYEVRLQSERLTPKHYSETLKKGKDSLSEYYDRYLHDFNCNCLVDYDFGPDHVFIDDIPVTGKIDKVELIQNGPTGRLTANVVDFKTGNPDSKSSELKLGGDYYRQLIFYKLLADNDPNFKPEIVSGTIDFVQKSKVRNAFVKKDFQFTSEDEQEVRRLIKEVYSRIRSLEFKPSPDCEDKDDLHRLANKY